MEITLNNQPLHLSPIRRFALRLIAPDFDRLYRENGTLRERNADLHAQNESLRSAKPMTPEQWREVERITQEHRSLYKEQVAITLWLRDNGFLTNEQNAGLSFSKLVIKMMGGTQ
jgi:hypothetical protein